MFRLWKEGRKRMSSTDLAVPTAFELTRQKFPDAAIPRDEGAVVTSHDEIPGIVRKLKKFSPSTALLERERGRYSELRDDPEAKAVLAAHKALEEGRVLIDLDQVLRLSGGQRTINGRTHFWPALAVASPDDWAVYCRLHGDGTVQWRRGHGGALRRHRVVYELGEETYATHWDRWVQCMALTPRLPVALRRRLDRRSLRDKLVVWEADWKRPTERFHIDLNIDPALLEHVAGSLYSVEAVWDLSPVEAAALGPKAR